MESTPTLIEIANVYKGFDRRPVLRGVDLSVPGGTTTALLGNNGAGKTTLIRLVAGLTKPERGEIRLGGAMMKYAGSELRRYIGLVSHSPLLYEPLTAWENLIFFARLYDLDEPAARIETLLGALHLWHRRHDQVRTYSRGMIQRLAIARAILHDPPVLLLDEPDTGLDQASIELLQTLIEQLGSEHRAIVFSTHNLENALNWSHQISILARGKISARIKSDGYTVESLREVYKDAAA